MINYDEEFESVIVRHKPSNETYEAILLDTRYDGSIIFQIVGARAHVARTIVEDDNLEVDTLFQPSWVLVRKK